jgi:pimeloyl-ACP methyl ester carboxylesterase
MRLILLIVLAFMAITYKIEASSPLSGTISTSDNVSLAYEHFKNSSDTVIIICPGFYNSKDNRWMQKTVQMLMPQYDVIIFDLRGHGKSGGKFTWSSKEDIDVKTMIDYAKTQGYKKIGIVAFSLGAASAINAVSTRSDVDSMILISCPSNFNSIDFHFWEPQMFSDLQDNIDCKWEGKGARVGNFFLTKKKPIDSIKNIKTTPILFIQGDKDWVIKARHSKKLYDAAPSHKKLEIIKGGLHAERLIQHYPDKMKELILNWFSETMNTKRSN